MSGYPTTKSLYLSLLQPEVSLTMPLRPDEVPAVREESKMSVTSTASPAVLSTESHINFKSSMTEQLYVKCIGHLRSICARMKLTLTVTLQAVSLLHRYKSQCIVQYDYYHFRCNLGYFELCLIVMFPPT